MDSAWRFGFTLSDDGRPYPLEGCKVSFQAVKPDGTSILDWCRIEDNKVWYDTTDQFAAADGMVDCKLCVYGEDGERLNSKRFSVCVEGWAEASGLESTSEVPLLEGLIDSVRDLNVTADQAAEAAKASADEAKKSEEHAVAAAKEVDKMFDDKAKEETLQKVEGSVREAVDFLQIMAKNQVGNFQNYADIRNVIRAGLAKSFLGVGDQIVTPYAIEGGSTYQAPWDVKHIAEDGVYFGMHYAIPDDMQYDAPEAIYYAPDGLAAGTYNIKIGSVYGDGWKANASIQFTLTKAVPAGGQLYLDCGTNNANDPASSRNLTTYDAIGSATIVETVKTAAGTDGTNLGTIGAGNAHRTNGNLNAISRVVYGNGRYAHSAIRQWLNSEAAANAWWKPQNNWDRPPRSTDLNRAGFLTRLPKDFVAILDYNDIVVALNTQEGFETDRETVRDRIFLPSIQNLYINPQLAEVEGPDWDYYKTLAAESGLGGKFQQWKTYEILKHYNLTSAGGSLAPVTVWLRSCNRNVATTAWIVTSSGYVAAYTACDTYGSCPACKIQKIV